MRIARLLGIWFGLAVVVAAARPADACGVWTMADAGKRLVVRWDISSGLISKAGRRVGALYLDLEAKGGIKVVTSKRVVFDVKDGALRRYGKRIGKLTDDAITIGRKTFTFALTDQKDWHGLPAWTLTVKLGDEVVVTSDEATALCAPLEAARRGKPMPIAAQQDEIRRRVAYYLAWRERGM